MKKLYLSEKNKKIAGVCSGLGEYFNIDPVIIRLGFILFSLLNPLTIILYLIATLIIPQRNNHTKKIAPPKNDSESKEK
ncbi:PspC domain-containing protein [Halobacteroides halobius]|nr:PspC domain-containing protein [Halobacteroides halobius]